MTNRQPPYLSAITTAYVTLAALHYSATMPYLLALLVGILAAVGIFVSVMLLNKAFWALFDAWDRRKRFEQRCFVGWVLNDDGVEHIGDVAETCLRAWEDE